MTINDALPPELEPTVNDDNRKPKTIDTENMEYDPYDHEMLANEPNF